MEKNGLNATQDYQRLIELGLKYLSCGKEIEDTGNTEPDMDYVQDMDYIIASFRSDYGINLDKEEMHWWEFSNLINGLSNSDMGNCCILNRIRNLRSLDLSEIKDPKERKKMQEAKESVALKKKTKVFTENQKNNIDEFKRLAGIS